MQNMIEGVDLVSRSLENLMKYAEEKKVHIPELKSPVFDVSQKQSEEYMGACSEDIKTILQLLVEQQEPEKDDGVEVKRDSVEEREDFKMSINSGK